MKHEAHFDICDSKGVKALLLAALLGHVFWMLLDDGLDVNGKENSGYMGGGLGVQALVLQCTSDDCSCGGSTRIC